MLLELGVWSGISYLLHRSLFGPVSDKKKIEKTFENTGFRVKDKLPMHCYTHKKKGYTVYAYNLPYGLTDNPKLEFILEKTLNKPVVFKMDTKLKIKVYKEPLRKKYDYSFVELPKWNVPIGYGLDGLITHDFSSVPHMTIAGATTWGKTVFMKMLMTHLIENNPDGVEFYILDLKGGLAFHRYRNLKQVNIVAGDLSDSKNALSMVKADIKRDLNYFKEINAENAKEAGAKTRKFIIIDEAGELVPHKSMSDKDKEHAKKCQEILSYIARVAGQLGYSLLFSTQYPTSDILDRQIKANSLAKVSFRLSTIKQSEVALDQIGAESLEYPGRAIYKTAEEQIVQTPFINNKEMWERLRRFEESDPTREKDQERRKDTVTFE
ncbi:FtsK/SpoIIIE domain-containing protein [Gracilibacillus sp. YIM 98692]|uniref:FtsK/SpoIIIE domain-containing protein n=1 Tax=Gracilibacillus sp. YIM 98692 TaxID=2663532 RepID=UPI0013D5D054|nr:FtsK/SpoIIIE domain-containing protein [Gracilibacillus sp. YIM 98692]